VVRVPNRDREVVAGCCATSCVLAHDAARLRTHGRLASELADGMPGWWLAGWPLATGAA
jgi:hypothetical protein